MTKSLLITGCSSGIGAHAARAMQARGWQVFATARKPEDVKALAADGLHALQLDYTDETSIAAAMTEVLDTTGGTLDALFNNGAYACPGAVEDLPTEALRELFDANFFGWHSLTRAALPVMRRQGHGRIVQCSSVLGFVTARFRGAYVASKYALEGLTDTLRIELRGSDIHVSLIQPGPITSRIRQNSIPHFERWIDWENSPQRDTYAPLLDRLYKGGEDRFELGPEAVTEKLIHALESPRPRSHYPVTTPTRLAAIIRRFLPKATQDRILAGR